MDFLNRLREKPFGMLKAIGVIFAGIVLLTIVFSLFGEAWGRFARRNGLAVRDMVAPSAMPAMRGGYGYDDAGVAYMEEQAEMAYGKGGAGMDLSIRNVMPIIPPAPGTTGDGAEDYEVTDYNATIETGDSSETCGEIRELKAEEYVIFESANEYDKGCNFTFKVRHTNVAEVLGFIETLDPRDLSENTHTIKSQVDDYTSAEEILRKKIASIDETLENALGAYDEVTAIATRSQDADALARIINGKIQLIERLTVERINASLELDRIARSKAEQLDRIDYTYFYVNVYENEFIDGESIADSWKQAVKSFVHDLNRVIQGVTLNLVLFLIVVAQYIIYILILVFLAKYVWRIVRSIWTR